MLICFFIYKSSSRKRRPAGRLPLIHIYHFLPLLTKYPAYTPTMVKRNVISQLMPHQRMRSGHRSQSGVKEARPATALNTSATQLTANSIKPPTHSTKERIRLMIG